MRKLVAILLVGILLMPTAVVAAPIRTGIFDPFTFSETTSRSTFVKIKRAGATFVRLPVFWSTTAPGGPASPLGFNSRNPTAKAYNWTVIDAQVRKVVGAGLEPVLVIYTAPDWAHRGPSDGGTPTRPNAEAFADFATAIAKRFSGRVAGLPRVKYWQAWNEPNITPYLLPQFGPKGKPLSPQIYRELVNAFSDAVHRVSGSNVVIAGGLSPFTVDYPTVKSVGPLRFMRMMLCMSAGPRPRPTCSTKVRFDVWAHHPYTSGNAFHKAGNPDDVSLGDLPEMRALLDAARRARHLAAPKGLGFWVTEFSWDAKPEDPLGISENLQARWVAEALFQMHRSGVTVAIWFLLQGRPYPASSYQSGLYTGDGSISNARPKPVLSAFRFPAVAYLREGSVLVWGRTPGGVRARVVVERRVGDRGRWRVIATLRTDRHGIFERTVPVNATKNDWIRARVRGTSQRALPFSLTEPRDRVVSPFGGPR